MENDDKKAESLYGERASTTKGDFVKTIQPKNNQTMAKLTNRITAKSEGFNKETKSSLKKLKKPYKALKKPKRMISR